jgi:hypothetical protein
VNFLSLLLGPAANVASTATASYLSEQQRQQALEDAAKAQVQANIQTLQMQTEQQRQAQLQAAYQQARVNQVSTQVAYGLLGLVAVAGAGYVIYRVVKKRK